MLPTVVAARDMGQPPIPPLRLDPFAPGTEPGCWFAP
jgi:hypothetical protein